MTGKLAGLIGSAARGLWPAWSPASPRTAPPGLGARIPVRLRRLRLGSASIHYQTAGSGPPVVLIHGLGGSARWWMQNISSLAQRFRVFALDLVGFGRSRGCFVLEQAAERVAGWMARLSLPAAAVVGHSMGGWVAARLAADFPERVGKLVLVNAVALPLEFRLTGYLRGLAHGASRLHVPLLSLMVQDALRCGPRTFWRATRQIFAADIRPKLPAIQAPSLIVWGEKDYLIPVDTARALYRSLPGARLAVVKNAGHNVMWDQPEEFNRTVAQFLESEARDVSGPARVLIQEAV
jgi:pimeloyl-ACP methyl ester carboxylesterase